MPKTNQKYIHVTDSGKVYITEADFFKRPAFKEQLEKLMNSDLTKQIRERNKSKSKENQEASLEG